MNRVVIPNELETERLLLRRLSRDYAEVYYQNFTDKVTKYMYPSTPSGLHEIVDWITIAEEKIGNGTDFYFVILDKNTEEFIGGGGIHELQTKTPEPGIWIKEAAWGHKYGLEAVKKIVEWTRDNYDFDYITIRQTIGILVAAKLPKRLEVKRMVKLRS